MEMHFPTRDAVETVIEKFRFFVATGARWFHFGHAFWKASTQAKTVSALRETIEKFAALPEFPMVEYIKFL